MSIYHDFVRIPVEYGYKNPNTGIPFSEKAEKLNNIIGNIETGKIYGIAGRPTSGRASATDHMFLFSLLMWYEKFPEDEKPDLKIFYFSMKKNIKMKLQKFICLYLKIKHNLVLDPTTLTNGKGRLADDVYGDTAIQMAVTGAIEFFQSIEDKVLIFSHGKKKPSDIFNKMLDHMDTIGHTDKTRSVYTLDEYHSNALTFLFVDNVEQFAPELEESSVLKDDFLKKKFVHYLDILKNIYKIGCVINIPTKMQNYLRVKDGEPSYRDFSMFHDVVDVGVVMYNPYIEGNKGYANFPVDNFIIRNRNRLRTLTIAVNDNGPDNITIGQVFLAECGYMAETPSPIEEDKMVKLIEALKQI